jgi:hypothetical protein
MKSVSKKEMLDFIKDYETSRGVKLEGDVNLATEPPHITFNDFSRGNWPESIVASYIGEYDKDNPEHGFKILVVNCPHCGENISEEPRDF